MCYKPLSILFLFLILSAGRIAAQGVGIGTIHPDTSSVLEVSSTGKGVLFPRMTRAQRIAIANPATGLLVYETDSIPGYWYNAGIPAAPFWVTLQTAAPGGLNSGSAPAVFPMSGIGGTVPPTGGYVFYGTPVNITLGSSKRVSGYGVVAFGGGINPAGSVWADLIYQPAGGSSPAPFSTAYPMVYTIGTGGMAIPVASSIVLPPGSYTIGYGVRNLSGTYLYNNSNMSGWIMVSEP